MKTQVILRSNLLAALLLATVALAEEERKRGYKLPSAMLAGWLENYDGLVNGDALEIKE